MGAREFTWLLSGVGDLRDEVLEAVRVALGPLDEHRFRIAMLYEFIFELPGLAYATTSGSLEAADANAAELSRWLARAREGLAEFA